MFGSLEKQHGLEGARRRARRTVMTAYGLLLIIALISGLVLHTQGGASLLPVFVRLLPLLLIAPAFWNDRPRGYFWMAFVSVIYCLQGALITTLPHLWWLGALETLAGVALLATAGSYARYARRWRQRDKATDQR